MTEDFDWYDGYLFHVHGTIERYGFFIQYVLGEHGEPSWGYSIGFLAHGHPEVVVYGLDDTSTAGVLHHLYDEIAVGEHRALGRSAAADLHGLEVCLLPVPDVHWTDESSVLCTAVQYSRAVGWDAVAAVQLVWPAPSGHFPWQPECPPRFRRLQPILDPPSARAA